MRKIIEACREAADIPRFWPVWYGQHWELLVRLIWETGHRLNPLLQLPRSAIDVEQRVIRVPAEFTKSLAEDVKEISQDTADLIIVLPQHESGLLLPWPFVRATIWPRFRNLLIAAHLPCDRRSLFHKLRRTSASYVCRELGPYAAQQHLQHADLATTRRYLDPRIATSDEPAVRVLPKL